MDSANEALNYSEDFLEENQQNRVDVGGHEQEQDCHSTAPPLQPYSASYKHQTNQPMTYEAEHSPVGLSLSPLLQLSPLQLSPLSQRSLDVEELRTFYAENPQTRLPGGANEQVQDCHSFAPALQPSSGIGRGNGSSVQFFKLLDGSHEHHTNQPMIGAEHWQAGDNTLQLAPLTDKTGVHDQPKQYETDKIKERKKTSQKKSRDKKRQEAMETKENLEKASKEVERLKRELDGYVKSDEKKEKEIVELKQKGFQMQETIKVLENKIEKLKGKQRKLKGKYDELLQQAHRGRIGKSSSWRKITHGNWEFNIKGSGVYLKLINHDLDDIDSEGRTVRD